MDREIAKCTMSALMQFSAPLNALSIISDKLDSAAEGREMRQSLAAIMIAIDEIMRPVISKYPELDPDH
jgi:hypothetical protein